MTERPGDAVAGTVLDIRRCSVHDGPGARTAVFLKGCPLRCAWCHNPESQSPTPQIAFHPPLCVGCGECVPACPRRCHALDASGVHRFSREACTQCGRCAHACPAGAMELFGRRMTVSQVIAQVARDKPYYAATGGGLTLSGGEPMFQFDFSAAVLDAARREGIATAMETCGHAESALYRSVAPRVDLFLFDIKETDAAGHRAHTGQDSTLIHSNLALLDSVGAAILLRVPVIPGIHDHEAHFRAVGQLADSLRHCVGVNVMPYHTMGRAKYEAIGREYSLPDAPAPDEAEPARWVEQIARHTRHRVARG